MVRNVARQVERATLPSKVEALTTKVEGLTFAVDQIIGALINARLIEVEIGKDGHTRLVPAKPKPKRSLWIRMREAVVGPTLPPGLYDRTAGK